MSSVTMTPTTEPAPAERDHAPGGEGLTKSLPCPFCGATPHRYGHAQEVARSFGVELSVLEIYRACARAERSMTFSWTEFV